jgi:peptidoglycan/xylan/chitin deacetylase (PgdA/CDA1 family)
MYHRIATAAHDHWQLSVSPRHFEEQLQVLTRYKVIELHELVNSAPRNGIAISFDDGYIDNYTTAKLLLEKYNLPATFFITNNNIGKQAEFWWDELENIFSNDPALHLQTWQQLFPLTHQQQQQQLRGLRSNNHVRGEYTCMSSQQLQEIARHPLFSIGAHTETHVALAHQLAEVQRQEIANNAAWLKELTGKAPVLLAYPYGNYNEATMNIALEEGFDAAFTTEEQPVTEYSPRYRLGRFMVKDWNGQTFEQHLRSWLKM